jgi:type II restriction/modification system DNA methylase subunit YeeA
MDLGQLERYAPQARLDFIQAVTARASKLGISSSEVLEAKKSGDALIIGGNVFPASIDHKRKVLVDRVEKDGFDKVMEEAAYTWFNRFTAMRYMEIHGYIEEHPFSLFESTDGSSEPEVLKNVTDLNDWKELNFNLALDLRTQNKTEELYRLILTAQCNSLGKVIPFLFSYHAAETELLLPDGLLLSDSIIKEMISVLNEENLGEVESLGWLYQFYISEKKESLIKAKKVIKSEDIPPVTQLFTPNWIVKYLTQNSIGRLWLSVYPSSPLKGNMEFYIEPAVQTDEVTNQLAEITPDSLDPEKITILDPACGSGHILIEAYNLLKDIYLERGYQISEIPVLILKNNIFGLDIDDRATQLARLTLLMKARQDDKRLFRSKGVIELNVYAIQESNGYTVNDFKTLGIDGIEELISTFQNAKTLGSLITISESLSTKVDKCSVKVNEIIKAKQQTLDSDLARQLVPLVNQAKVMSKKYDAVIANPPYMGSKGLNPILKGFALEHYPSNKSDLFAISIERFLKYVKPDRFNGFMSPFTWMFIKTYESLRSLLINEKHLISLIQPEYHAFFDSAYVPICCFVCQNSAVNAIGDFIDLSEFYGVKLQPIKTLEAIQNPKCNWRYQASSEDFKKISGIPIAYWVTDDHRKAFKVYPPLSEFADVKQGLATANNDRFLRKWTEVSTQKVGWNFSNVSEAVSSGKKWFPYNKGGDFRKWYGNWEYLVNWEFDGEEIRNFGVESGGKPRSRAQNTDYYFKQSISWSFVSSSYFGVRYSPQGAIFDVGGSSAFPKKESNIQWITCILCSKLAFNFMKTMNPTLNFQVGNVSAIPIKDFSASNELSKYAENAIQLTMDDWNQFEKSWGFNEIPIVNSKWKDHNLFESYKNWILENKHRTKTLLDIETSLNRILISNYCLQEELSPEAVEAQITLTINPKYRYSGSNLPEEKLWQRFQFDTIKELISYSVGCMMGRYSLNEQGLIYAHSNNEGFDSSKYKTFPADEDGVITLSDMEDLMVRDDIATRFTEFLVEVWGKETLSENLKFVADTLGSKTNELPKETIRRWISTDFFKDHLQRYKNRPIYWLFSSGKKKAFEALVYLHRYNESTLSKMRMKYVVPLQTRISDQLKTIDDDIDSASAQERNRLTKKKKLLIEKEIELRKYDETLRHLAEQQIKLDLDDGVKVNYGKFPGLLAETKKVCGE